MRTIGRAKISASLELSTKGIKVNVREMLTLSVLESFESRFLTIDNWRLLDKRGFEHKI